ncbi:MAG: sn-glycerol-3-phosphate ABC transporter ATP-binding protein UgpC [Variovorax sp.]
MAGVRLEKLQKSYGEVPVVRGIDLTIPDGEFTVLLGPSGCGKSTLLRLIAGLEEADEGEIHIGDRAVTDLRPRDRDVAMVFQNYALYPYMTVYDNIAFGLRVRKLSEREIREQVAEVARVLEIEPLLGRAPRQLSGGQRQRVAMGRAMVRKPKLFLFDEPLSNLDAQLRDGMRTEIKRLHQAFGITTIYVTHDQVEAMTLADRVVLMNQGMIEQQGPPMQLYDQPINRFVAGFLGSPPINNLKAHLQLDGQGASVRLADGQIVVLPPERAAQIAAGAAAATNRETEIVLGLRPEHFLLHTGDSAAIGVGLSSTITLLQPSGARVFASFELAGAPVMAEFSAREGLRQGHAIAFNLDMERAVLLDTATGLALCH